MSDNPAFAFAIGQTVRWSAQLRAAWHDGCAEAGHPAEAPVGRIVSQIPDGYCGTCDADGRDDCAGPWYGVDFDDGPGSGSYAQHELEAA